MDAPLLILLAALASSQDGTRSVPITGDRLSGFVIPVEPIEGEIQLGALHAWTWTIDDTKRLVLEGNVRVRIGDYSFTDGEAVVWVNRIPSQDGLINQIAAWFPHLENPTDASGFGVSGDDVLITGSARGGVRLDVALLDAGPPPEQRALVRRAERRLQAYLINLTASPPPLASVPQADRPAPIIETTPAPGAPVGVVPPEKPLTPSMDLPATDQTPPPMFRAGGTFFCSWGRVTVLGGTGDESAIVADNGISIQYVSDQPETEWSQLTLTAERAVVFTEPHLVREVLEGRATAESIKGIYLEGAVVATADAGRYTVRATHVYYDVRADRAIMLDAVLRTYNRRHDVPVYARALELRQLAADQWDARRAIVSTSEFFTPHLAVGARRVTVTQRPAGGGDRSSAGAPGEGPGGPGGPGVPGGIGGPGGGSGPTEPGLAVGLGGVYRGVESTAADGRATIAAASGGGGGGSGGDELFLEVHDLTLRLGGVPLAWWPGYAGTMQDLPLRGVEVGSRTTQGVRILTQWNPFTLLGLEDPKTIDAELSIDGYTERGPALGWRMTYGDADGWGDMDLYGLHDDGIDRTSSGFNVTPPTEWRGIALFNHTQMLSEHWEFQGQVSAISDETFVTSWREQEFYNRREFETSAYTEYQNNNWALNLLAKYNINDFISNSYLLASRAYQVQKVPELTYRRYGDRLGPFTYSGETRLTRMRASFQTGTAAELGVPGAAVGLPANADIEAAFMASGFPTKFVSRFDTRQELAVPIKMGFMNAVPYAVGRITAYDDDFAEFSADARSTRFFGALGVRVAGQLQTVDNTAESRLFDVHRLRTILEPRLTAWYGVTNVDEGALPVYDQSVEAIGGGSVVQVALNTTLQTQRGGPGRWRSVDLLDLDLGYVFNSNDVNIESPIPRFYEYRPEQSVFGSHIFGTMKWTLSDQFAIVGEARYDTDRDEIITGSIGTSIQHSPLLTTFIEYRYLEPSDNRLLEIGWVYQLTSKYRMNFRPQWDFEANDFRAISLVLVRSFPDFNLSLSVRRDEIANETTFGASLDLADF